MAETLYLPGQHGLLDLYGCTPELLSDPSSLQRALEQAAHLANATILFSHFHHFGEGGGVTGVLLLAESHFSIHTWVEHRFAAVDIFLSGQKNPQTAAQFLQQALHAEHTVWHCRSRGTHITS